MADETRPIGGLYQPPAPEPIAGGSPATQIIRTGAPAPVAGSVASGGTMILRREPPSFAWLVVASGGRSGDIYPLQGDSTQIGRAGTNHIALSDDAAVSTTHAKVKVELEGGEAQFWLYDLGSSNGTSLNGNDVSKQPQALTDNDVVVIGETKLIFKRVPSDVMAKARNKGL